MFATHDDHLHLIMIVLMVAMFLSYFVANSLIVRSHPELALLEGAHLLDYYRFSQGVIGMREVAEMPSIENPLGPPSLTSAEGD